MASPRIVVYNHTKGAFEFDDYTRPTPEMLQASSQILSYIRGCDSCKDANNGATDRSSSKKLKAAAAPAGRAIKIVFDGPGYNHSIVNVTNQKEVIKQFFYALNDTIDNPVDPTVIPLLHPKMVSGGRINVPDNFTGAEDFGRESEIQLYTSDSGCVHYNNEIELANNKLEIQKGYFLVDCYGSPEPLRLHYYGTLGDISKRAGSKSELLTSVGTLLDPATSTIGTIITTPFTLDNTFLTQSGFITSGSSSVVCTNIRDTTNISFSSYKICNTDIYDKDGVDKYNEIVSSGSYKKFTRADGYPHVTYAPGSINFGVLKLICTFGNKNNGDIFKNKTISYATKRKFMLAKECGDTFQSAIINRCMDANPDWKREGIVYFTCDRGSFTSALLYGIPSVLSIEETTTAASKKPSGRKMTERNFYYYKGLLKYNNHELYEQFTSKVSGILKSNQRIINCIDSYFGNIRGDKHYAGLAIITQNLKNGDFERMYETAPDRIFMYPHLNLETDATNATKEKIVFYSPAQGGIYNNGINGFTNTDSPLKFINSLIQLRKIISEINKVIINNSDPDKDMRIQSIRDLALTGTTSNNEADAANVLLLLGKDGLYEKVSKLKVNEKIFTLMSETTFMGKKLKQYNLSRDYGCSIFLSGLTPHTDITDAPISLKTHIPILFIGGTNKLISTYDLFPVEGCTYKDFNNCTKPVRVSTLGVSRVAAYNMKPSDLFEKYTKGGGSEEEISIDCFISDEHKTFESKLEAICNKISSVMKIKIDVETILKKSIFTSFDMYGFVELAKYELIGLLLGELIGQTFQTPKDIKAAFNLVYTLAKYYKENSSFYPCIRDDLEDDEIADFLSFDAHIKTTENSPMKEEELNELLPESIKPPKSILTRRQRPSQKKSTRRPSRKSPTIRTTRPSLVTQQGGVGLSEENRSDAYKALRNFLNDVLMNDETSLELYSNHFINRVVYLLFSSFSSLIDYDELLLVKYGFLHRTLSSFIYNEELQYANYKKIMTFLLFNHSIYTDGTFIEGAIPRLSIPDGNLISPSILLYRILVPNRALLQSGGDSSIMYDLKEDVNIVGGSMMNEVEDLQRMNELYEELSLYEKAVYTVLYYLNVPPTHEETMMIKASLKGFYKIATQRISKTKKKSKHGKSFKQKRQSKKTKSKRTFIRR